MLAGADGRSRRARRRRDLIVGLVAELGGTVSDGAMVGVIRAVDLLVICETKRAAAIRGEPVDLGALAKLENSADRAMRRLNFKRSSPDAPLPWKPSRGRLAASLTQGGAG
ncbi:hypothetical protein [Nitrobacter sp.]|uniref:hypothetical protein n=1 Tax=Nitrobacter sp. TaxID=29420 RepID=UPI0029CABE1B|nr:hypothetical protein [Nitrobacter sp.]